MDGGTQRIIRAVRFLCDTVHVDTCRYTCVQSTGYLRPRAPPGVDLGGNTCL